MRFLTLTLAEEFKEARDWLAQHRRDPFLWLVILMPLTFATLTVGVPAILMSIFPFSDAKLSLGEVLPITDSGLYVKTTTVCKLPRGTYIFGYDFGVIKTNTGRERFGRICRDFTNGRWIFAADYEL